MSLGQSFDRLTLKIMKLSLNRFLSLIKPLQVHIVSQNDCDDTTLYRVAQKTGSPAILSHCKYSENSMTESHGNWWTSAILYAEHSH